MAKRCWGLTWNFQRCKNERLKLPVCQKHIWQFIQLIVVVFVGGAVILTIELVHIYDSYVLKKNQEIVIEGDNDKNATGK